MKPVLVFFGCSWTWGKFINWETYGESRYTIDKVKEEEHSNLYSYRALITKNFGFDQINFSRGGNSNDRQFRLAKEYFIGPNHSRINQLNRIKGFTKKRYESIRDLSWPSFDQLLTNPYLADYILDELNTKHDMQDLEFLRKDCRKHIVLWFITSTARKEFYNASQATWENFMMMDNTDSLLKKVWFADYYDHNKELETLAQNMILWNSWFKQNNITNFWIDTFNHHEYMIDINNKIDFQTGYSDLMSNLCVLHGFVPDKTEYHYSAWNSDEPRCDFLISKGLLNQSTLHPTQLGHKIIAEQLLLPRIQNTLIN